MTLKKFSSRTLRVSAALAASALLVVALASGACSSDGGKANTGGSGNTGNAGGSAGEGPGSGGDCVGGVVDDAGLCEGKCTPDKCLADNTCVGNRCVLKCDSDLDCYGDGSQDCAADVEDDTNAAITVCKDNGKASGWGYLCAFGNECSMLLACPNGRPCGPQQCSGQPDKCVLDPIACKGVENCTIGRCPGDLGFLPCTVGPDTCAPEQCQPMSCLSAGEGDADAYCTRHDCTTDADCAGGFFCGITRDPHQLCGAQKGNSNLCGKTAEPCIDAANFAVNGATYFEGQYCILRKTCIVREQCAPCESDIDCSRSPGQRCVDIGGSKRCSRDCTNDGDCDANYGCKAGSCIPRMGACEGTGKFCEMCQDDTDCGDVNSDFACVEMSGGQRGCFDLSFPDLCTIDNDCPTAPASAEPGPAPLHGECLDDFEGVPPGDAIYHHCYLPEKLVQGTPKFTCWQGCDCGDSKCDAACGETAANCPEDC